jgi:hypothetical protein
VSPGGGAPGHPAKFMSGTFMRAAGARAADAAPAVSAAAPSAEELALAQMLAAPQLVSIAEAARKDPTTLQPALLALHAEAPHLILLAQQNQAAFRALLTGSQPKPAHSSETTAPTPPAVPAPAAPAAAAPASTPGPLTVTLVYKGSTSKLEIDLADGVEILRLQVFSLTDVPPDEQQIMGCAPQPRCATRACQPRRRGADPLARVVLATASDLASFRTAPTSPPSASPTARGPPSAASRHLQACRRRRPCHPRRRLCVRPQ